MTQVRSMNLHPTSRGRQYIPEPSPILDEEWLEDDELDLGELILVRAEGWKGAKPLSD